MIHSMILERGRERQEERNISQLPPTHTPTREKTLNPGMCPDQKLNPWPFGAQQDAPTNQSHTGHGLVINVSF